MSILDVTEDQIFSTLGKGKDPNFKPIEKTRPVIEKPNKTYSPTKPYIKPVPKKVNNPVNFKTGQTHSIQMQEPSVRIEAPAEPVIIAPMVQAEDPLKKIEANYSELNERVISLQNMVKLYTIPQFVVILILVAAFILKA